MIRRNYDRLYRRNFSGTKSAENVMQTQEKEFSIIACSYRLFILHLKIISASKFDFVCFCFLITNAP